ncbi:MAG: TetR/AcrR family transcriptional regulator [Firmicutes bacterium]|nr:TetR/AcrR family transcriptional regulator [Bacillota bacterium]
MARVTKDPEERKHEIMLAAFQLFATKGFEETAVSDIVKKVGVAQGLFYYYFKSKEEVLEAVMEHYTKELVCKIKQITMDSSNNTLEKMQRIFDAFFDFGEYDDRMISFAHSPENADLHQRFMFQTIKKVLPDLIMLVKEGIDEGIFVTEYPEDTASILLLGIGTYIHSIDGFFEQKEVFMTKRKSFLEIISKTLGVKIGFRSQETGDSS